MHDNAGFDLLHALEALRHRNFRYVLHNLGEASSHLQVHGPYSRAVYFRLHLPRILPELARVLYLDVDLLVRRDLGPLYDMTLDGFAFGAVPDYLLYYFESNIPIAVGGTTMPLQAYLHDVLGIGYSVPEDYFNSGVMLINLEYWRAHDVPGRCFTLAGREGGLFWVDQDALNSICKAQILVLDPRWNTYARGLNPSPFGMNPALTTLQQMWRDDPWIVHYSGHCKPWEASHARTAFDGLFWRIALETPAGKTLRARYVRERSGLRLSQLRALPFLAAKRAVAFGLRILGYEVHRAGPGSDRRWVMSRSKRAQV